MFLEVFQSTRPRGARLENSVSTPYFFKFQSTRPRGSRLLADPIADMTIYVSIHAPAWGATHNLILQDGVSISFNPRARVGRDVSGPMPLPFLISFQSTRPRGARRGYRIWPGYIKPSFNPRARVGRDFVMSFNSSSAHSFNPRARVGRDPASHR